MKNKIKYRVLHIPAEKYPTHEAFLSEVLARKNACYEPVFLMAAADDDTSQREWEGVLVYTFLDIPRFKPTKWINTYFFVDLRHLVMMIKIIYRHRINIIQVRDLTFPLLFALLFKWLFKISVIYQKSHPMEYKKIADARNNVHDQVFPRLFYWSRVVENKLLHRAIRSCDAILPITSYMADNLCKDYALHPDKMEPFGLGFEFTQRFDITVVPPQDDSLLKLIYVGTLAPERQLDILLHGLALLRDTPPPLPFIMQFVGGTPQEVTELQKIAASLGLKACCLFTGRIARQQVYEMIMASDIGVSWIGAHRRFSDASPTKAIEYLALGLPVLATDTVMEHGKLARDTGALAVCQLDPDDFVRQILFMKKNHVGFRGKAMNAQEYMKGNYSYENMRLRLMGLYEKLIRRNSEANS